MPVAAQPARHMVALAVLLMLLSGIVVTLAVPIIANAFGVALNVTVISEPAAAPGFAADDSTPAPVAGGLTDAELWWAASVALSVVVLGGLAIVGRLLWRRNSQ